MQRSVKPTSILRSLKELLVLGLLLEVGLGLLLALSGLDRGSASLEIWFIPPFLIYAFAVWRISRTETDATRLQTGTLILLFAIVFNVTILLSTSALSNDIYRYYWDGKTTYFGFNPYAHSPDENVLAPLRDSNWEKVMNPDVHTMYPPLAQVVFAVAYALSPGISSLKLLAVVFHLLASVALLYVLMQFKVDTRYTIIYAWSPLATVEFANSGHIDSLALFLMLLSVLALLLKRNTSSAVLMALAILGKIFPILYAGLFFPRWGKRGVALFAGVLAIAYVPFVSAEIGLLQGSSYFVDRGLFNGSLFPLLGVALEQLLLRPVALRVAKLVVVVLFAILFAALFLMARRDRTSNLQILSYSMGLVGAFLLITPTMHPWYLTWILPFLCIFPSSHWILLTGTAVLARTVYIGFDATGVWKEIPWIPFAEYLPFYTLMAWGPIRRIGAWLNDEPAQEAAAAAIK